MSCMFAQFSILQSTSAPKQAVRYIYSKLSLQIIVFGLAHGFNHFMLSLNILCPELLNLCYFSGMKRTNLTCLLSQFINKSFNKCCICHCFVTDEKFIIFKLNGASGFLISGGPSPATSLASNKTFVFFLNSDSVSDITSCDCLSLSSAFHTGQPTPVFVNQSGPCQNILLL